MMICSCQCGAVSMDCGEAPPPECVGCMACQTSLSSYICEIEPNPPVRIWRPLVPHQPGPIDRDDPNSPVICRACGAHDH